MSRSQATWYRRADVLLARQRRLRPPFVEGWQAACQWVALDAAGQADVCAPAGTWCSASRRRHSTRWARLARSVQSWPGHTPKPTFLTRRTAQVMEEHHGERLDPRQVRRMLHREVYVEAGVIEPELWRRARRRLEANKHNRKAKP